MVSRHRLERLVKAAFLVTIRNTPIEVEPFGNLDALLSTLFRDFEHGLGEDLAVWQGARLVAVIRDCGDRGEIVRFDLADSPRPAA
jgi:hypothetical protein